MDRTGIDWVNSDLTQYQRNVQTAIVRPAGVPSSTSRSTRKASTHSFPTPSQTSTSDRSVHSKSAIPRAPLLIRRLHVNRGATASASWSPSARSTHFSAIAVDPSKVPAALCAANVAVFEPRPVVHHVILAETDRVLQFGCLLVPVRDE